MKYAVVLLLCLFLISQAPAQTEPSASPGASQPTQQPQASAPAAPEPQPAPTASKAPAQQQQPKVKPGSKDDVNAIGDRQMGGKGLGITATARNWTTVTTLLEMAAGADRA